MSNRPRSAHDIAPTYIGSSAHPDSFFERLKRGLPPKYIEPSAHPDSFFERLKRGLPPKYIEPSAHPDSFFERLKRGLPPEPNSSRALEPMGETDEEARCAAGQDDAYEIVDDERLASGWITDDRAPPSSQGGGGAVEEGA